MFPNKITVINPWVMFRREIPPLDFKFVMEIKEGEFFLVIPSTSREVVFLQLLGKNIGCWLPASGEGLLIKCDSMRGL